MRDVMTLDEDTPGFCFGGWRRLGTGWDVCLSFTLTFLCVFSVPFTLI